MARGPFGDFHFAAAVWFNLVFAPDGRLLSLEIFEGDEGQDKAASGSMSGGEAR